MILVVLLYMNKEIPKLSLSFRNLNLTVTRAGEAMVNPTQQEPYAQVVNMTRIVAPFFFRVVKIGSKSSVKGRVVVFLPLDTILGGVTRTLQNVRANLRI